MYPNFGGETSPIYLLTVLLIQLLNPCRDFLVEIYYSKDSLYFVSFRHDDPEKVFSTNTLSSKHLIPRDIMSSEPRR